MTVENNIPQAKAELDELEQLGISYDKVTQQLQDEGVQKFADSFHDLFKGIADKKNAIAEKQAAH
jgi:transaldolase